MAYPSDSPLANKEIRILVGSACYVESAISAGFVWGVKKLETIIDGRRPPDYTKRYKRMPLGTVPDPYHSDRIDKKLKDQNCQVTFWREYVFWKFLTELELSETDIEKALLSTSLPIRRKIWINDPLEYESQEFRIPRYLPYKDMLNRISRKKNFDAFLALVALAREGRNTGMLQEFAVASRLSYDIFPDSMIKQPHLYIRWKLLAKRMNEFIWNPKSMFELEPKIAVSYDALSKKIARLDSIARKKGFSLPPLDIIQKYNP